MDDLRALLRDAHLDLAMLIGAFTDDDLPRQTPCAGWDLGELLAHMIGQHIGFAAAVRDGDAPAAAYAPVPFDPDVWRRSVEELQIAFADAELTAEVLQIELSATRTLPVGVLVGAQLLDTAVHAWDVAGSLGRDHVPSAEIAAAVLAVAESIPDGTGRDEPGAAFAHRVAGDHSSAWDRSLALLGRRPTQPLRGERVTLRSALDSDIDTMAAIRSLPEVRARWRAADDLRKELFDDIHAIDLHLLAILVEDRIVGGIQWAEEPDPDYRHASIDIYLHPDVHGRGIGPDAIRTLARELFTRRGHHRVSIDPAADNVAAIRCYSKVGFQPVGVLRRYERGTDGVWHDGLLMDLLVEDLAGTLGDSVGNTPDRSSHRTSG